MKERGESAAQRGGTPHAGAWAMVIAVTFYGEMAAWILAPAVALLGEPEWAGGFVAFALGARLVMRTWSRLFPGPMPYQMRGVLLVPRGPHSSARLNEVLQPRRGERILEVGPGVGVHALPVAAALAPDGVLDVVDVQQDMLDDLMRRAERRGLSNIVPRLGDARTLPYPDRTFDAGYLISVLGEIPDPRAALGELRRVLKTSGRLVVCEMLIDPDYVTPAALQDMARPAGFALERLSGPRFAYRALLRPVDDAGREVRTSARAGVGAAAP